MPSRFAVPFALAALLLAGATVFFRPAPSPAGAQASATQLLYNEVAEWCPRIAVNPSAGACNGARFETLPDGTIRVVLDINPGSDDSTPGKCVAGIAFPDDVVGSAYVIEGDRWGVLALSGVKETSLVCEFTARRVTANG